MTQRGAPQFPLRFPDEAMRDRIKAQAKANRRTMNAEILHRLEAYERQQMAGDRALNVTDLPRLFAVHG
jgi:hypothetical protein